MRGGAPLVPSSRGTTPSSAQGDGFSFGLGPAEPSYAPRSPTFAAVPTPSMVPVQHAKATPEARTTKPDVLEHSTFPDPPSGPPTLVPSRMPGAPPITGASAGEIDGDLPSGDVSMGEAAEGVGSLGADVLGTDAQEHMSQSVAGPSDDENGEDESLPRGRRTRAALDERDEFVRRIYDQVGTFAKEKKFSRSDLYSYFTTLVGKHGSVWKDYERLVKYQHQQATDVYFKTNPSGTSPPQAPNARAISSLFDAFRKKHGDNAHVQLKALLAEFEVAESQRTTVRSRHVMLSKLKQGWTDEVGIVFNLRHH